MQQRLGLNMDMQIGKTVGTKVQPDQNLRPQKRVQYVKMDLALNYIQQMQKDMQKMNQQHKYLVNSIQNKFKKIQQESQNYFLECYRDQRTNYKKKIAHLQTDLRETNQRLKNAISDYQNSNTAWLKEKNQLSHQNLSLAEKMKRDEQTNDKFTNDHELHINNLQIAQTKLSDKLKKISREKKSIAKQSFINQQDIIQMTVDNMITQIELFQAKGEEKIVYREVPVQSPPRPPQFSEQNSVDQDSILVDPEIRANDYLREEEKTPAMMKIMKQDNFKIEPNQEKFQEGKREVRMVEFQMNPMKQKLIGMVQKEEKGLLSADQQNQMEVVLKDYQEKLAELKAKQIKASMFQSTFSVKQDLLETVFESRRSLDAIGPTADSSKKLQNQNQLLKKDIAKVLAQKQELAIQNETLKKIKSDWMRTSKGESKQKEQDIKLKAAGAAALSIGKDNQKLQKKLKSLEAQIEQFQLQKNQLEEQKLNLVDRQQYHRLQASNNKLTMDINVLRQQLGQKMTDKKMQNQFLALQKQNNEISADLARTRKQKQELQIKATQASTVLSIDNNNQKMKKKIKSLEAEIEQYKNQKNQQEEVKQNLLIDKVDKQEYLRVQAQNQNLTKDIGVLRKQLGDRISDKKVQDQFQNLQKQNNDIQVELAKVRKEKAQASAQLQEVNARAAALQNQRDHIQKAFDEYQKQTPRRKPAESVISQEGTNLAVNSIIGQGPAVVGAASPELIKENQEIKKQKYQLELAFQQAKRDKQALEVEREQLSKNLKKTETELASLQKKLEQSNKGGEKSSKQLKKKIEQLKSQTDAKINDLQGQLGEVTKERDELRQKFQKLQKDKLSSIGSLQKKLTQITAQHQQLTQANNAMSKQIDDMTKAAAKMNDDLQAAKKVAGKADQLKTDLAAATSQLSEVNRHVAQVDQKYKQQVLKRKKLHNQLEDMKGKIRVYARARPVNQNQKDMQSPVVVSIPDEFSINVQVKTGLKAFTFDTCFGPDSTQEQIFEDTKRLVQSAIDGFNVCVFAYGQTGSGKTFTIQGPENNPGVAPRAIHELFEITNEMNHCQIKIQTYMVELYLDDLNDLLLDKKAKPQKLDIKEDPNGMMYIQGVTKKQIFTIQEAETIFASGLNSRKIAKTNMNSESSRSHLIFSMLIDVRNNATGKKTVGKLSFIDLAGSERLNKTDATSKERINQSKAINQSLSALSNVISKLADGNSKFVPYRDHKLTLLMKDSIGGNAKTLMFVNVSPVEYNASETVQSLGYAMRVKEIKNDVSKNTESLEVSRYKQRCRELEMLNDKFKGLLQENDIAFENIPQEDYDIQQVKIGG